MTMIDKFDVIFALAMLGVAFILLGVALRHIGLLFWIILGVAALNIILDQVLRHFYEPLLADHYKHYIFTVLGIIAVVIYFIHRRRSYRY